MLAISFVIGVIVGAAAFGLILVYMATDGTQHMSDDWAKH